MRLRVHAYGEAAESRDGLQSVTRERLPVALCPVLCASRTLPPGDGFHTFPATLGICGAYG